MRKHRLLSSVFMALVVLRVGYATLLLGGTLAFRLHGSAPFPVNDYVGEVLRAIPAWYFLVWAGFVAGYVAAAACLVLRSFWALPIYAAAFACDFVVSLYWFQKPGMERAWFGSANLVEWSLNAFDLAVIAVLVLAGSAFTRSPD